MNPPIPVLYIAPTDDYPVLRSVKEQMFGTLPKNPRTKVYEPGSSHIKIPSASTNKIIEGRLPSQPRSSAYIIMRKFRKIPYS